MRIRKSARVVLVNERDEVFLFRHSGLLRSYWVLPGGGLEDGETWEETGISGVPLGPLLWTRQAHDRHQGEEVIQDERYYLVRCGMPEVTSEHQLDEEKRLYTRSRWWSLEAIRQTSETLYPERLADLLLPVIEDRISPSPLRLPE
jgi:ADP-ribose pyrophosphatase YjhB (NUDIX family)